MHRLLRNEKAVYPILSIVSMLTVFFLGLLIVSRSWVFIFLIGWFVLLALFGYGRAVVIVGTVAIPVGIVMGAMTLGFATPVKAFHNGLRFYLLAVATIPMMSLNPLTLVRCMNQLGLPRWLTIGMLINLRFGPVVFGEMRQVRMAMRLRGVNVSMLRPTIVYRAFIVPFMVRLMSLSDTLALSLETRAFTMEGGIATQWKRVDFQRRDCLFALALCVLIGLTIIGIIIE